MKLTIARIILLIGFLFLYTQELMRLIRKVTSVPGVKLLLPLLFVSWLIETYEDWARWLLLYTRAKFHNTLQFIAECLPFQAGSLHVIRIAALFLLACIPAWILWYNNKRRVLHSLPMPYCYVSVVVWIVLVFLLTVQS